MPKPSQPLLFSESAYNAVMAGCGIASIRRPVTYQREAEPAVVVLGIGIQRRDGRLRDRVDPPTGDVPTRSPCAVGNEIVLRVIGPPARSMCRAAVWIPIPRITGRGGTQQGMPVGRAAPWNAGIAEERRRRRRNF